MVRLARHSASPASIHRYTHPHARIELAISTRPPIVIPRHGHRSSNPSRACWLFISRAGHRASSIAEPCNRAKTALAVDPAAGGGISGHCARTVLVGENTQHSRHLRRWPCRASITRGQSWLDWTLLLAHQHASERDSADAMPVMITIESAWLYSPRMR